MNTYQNVDYCRTLELLGPAMCQLQNAGVRSEAAITALADIAARGAFEAGGIKAVKRMAEAIVGQAYAWLVDDDPVSRATVGAKADHHKWEFPLSISIPIAHHSNCQPVNPDYFNRQPTTKYHEQEKNSY